MKKRIIITLLTLCLLLASCNSTPIETTPDTPAATQCAEHSFGEWQSIKDPTCLEGGTEARVCLNCDFSEERPTDTVDHLYGEWEVVEKSTIYTRGTEQCVCVYCQNAKTRNLDRVTKLSSKPVFNFQNK